MKGSLLFSSYPFITSEKATLTRVTDMDLEALWQILSDEDSHRFTPEAALRSHRECAAKLRQFDTMFQERRGVVLGQGYASAAVRATTEYLFRTVGVRRIQCFVLPINYRAVLVLERCGFVKEGTIREGFYWPDKGIVDLTVYSLLPTDKKPKSTGPAYYL